MCSGLQSPQFGLSDPPGGSWSLVAEAGVQRVHETELEHDGCQAQVMMRDPVGTSIAKRGYPRWCI